LYERGTLGQIYSAIDLSPSSVVYHAMQGSPSGAKIAQSNDMKGTRTIDT